MRVHSLFEAGGGSSGGSVEPTQREFEFFQEEKRTPIPAAYARWMLRTRSSREDSLEELFPLTADSSVHVDDTPEGLSVKAATSKYGDAHDWAAVMTGPSKYPLELVRAKRPNGHARVFDCAIEEVTWLQTDTTDLLVVRRQRREMLDKFFEMVNSVKDKLLHRGSTLVLVLEEFREPRMETFVEQLVSDLEPEEALLAVHEHAIDPTIFLVLNGVRSNSFARMVYWNEAAARTDAVRQNNIADALDFVRYLDAIGVETEAQCQQHEAEMTH
jgi:hypothetical protein